MTSKLNRMIFFCGILSGFFSFIATKTAFAQTLAGKFAYQEREFSLVEQVEHVSVVYAVTWVVYPVFQPDIMAGKRGSWQDYRNNFGRTVFDQDEPFWNGLVHPLSGSQLYLFYRGLGYERSHSFLMTFISSTLFEYTVEIYSEPASIQDLYQTPVFGTTLGYGLEILSVDLLNRDSAFANFMGRIVNPMSYLVDSTTYSMTPVTNLKDYYGFQLRMEW
ncbi:MAG: DUF3943 domain-containing protein [Oligoflexus sp.]